MYYYPGVRLAEQFKALPGEMYTNTYVIDRYLGTEFFSMCQKMNQLPVSHSVTYSAALAVKFPVSPQSCQAWRIECKAADK